MHPSLEPYIILHIVVGIWAFELGSLSCFADCSDFLGFSVFAVQMVTVK